MYKVLTVLSEWRATVDEDGHYCFAVALRCRSPSRTQIGKSATAHDLALRLAGCSGHREFFRRALERTPGQSDERAALHGASPC